MGFTSDQPRAARLHHLRRRTYQDAAPLAVVIVILVAGGWWLTTAVEGRTKFLAEKALPGFDLSDRLEAALRSLTEHLEESANEGDPARRPELVRQTDRHLADVRTLLERCRGVVTGTEERLLWDRVAQAVDELTALKTSAVHPDPAAVRWATAQARTRGEELAAWHRQRALAAAAEVHETTHLSWWFVSSISLVVLLLFARLVHRVIRRQNRYLEELQAQESRMQALVDGSLDAIVVIDDQQRIVLFNRAAERMFLTTAPEVLGRPLELLIPEVSRGAHLHLVGAFIHGSGPGRMMGEQSQGDWVARGFGRRMDGSLFPIESSLSRTTIDGRIFCTSQLRDITLRRQMETTTEQARHAAEETARAKGAFLALVSHEIRTPLNGVIGLLHQVAKHAPEAPIRDQILLAQDNAQHLLRILNDILDFSKLEAGQLSLESIPFDLHALLGQLHHLYHSQGAVRGLEVDLAVDPSLPRKILGDPLRLRQILGNLLHNALKFTTAGRIGLGARSTGGDQNRAALEFQVRDTGMGMTPEVLRHLFTPYAQADGTTARRFGGTGLGLSICHRLVTMQGGTIQVESAPGQGSTFTVRLEVPRAEEDSGVLVPVPPPGPGRWIGRVLVVDDEEINRLVCESWLQDVGVTAVLASSGAEALDILRTGPVDLILTDILMPDMDGVELLQRVRRESPRIPCVAVTGSVMPDEVDRWRAAGFTGVLAKPLQGGELHTVLGALLREAPDQAPGAVPETGAPGQDLLVDAPLANRWRALGHLAELRAAFTTTLDQRLIQLRNHPSPEEARLHTHALAGAAANLGLVRLARMARELEGLAEQGQVPDSDALERLGRLAQDSLEALGR